MTDDEPYPQDHLERITAERDALEKDAARYRWLRGEVCMGYPSGEGSNAKDAYLVVTGYGHIASPSLINAAIDAAMKEQK
jgi:hypothetical protein